MGDKVLDIKGLNENKINSISNNIITVNIPFSPILVFQ